MRIASGSKRRVRLAATYLEYGRAYFARVGSVRHRLAGLAYIARFQWLIETLEARRLPGSGLDYPKGGGLATGLRGSWHVLSSISRCRPPGGCDSPERPRRGRDRR